MALPARATDDQAPSLAPAVADRIRRAAQSAQAGGTRRAYQSAWRRFERWCAAQGHTSMPAHPATVAAYLVDAADTFDENGDRAYSPATLSKWSAAIADRHRRHGAEPPTAHEAVRATLAGIKREYATAGDRPRVPRAPLLTADVMELVTVARRQARGWAEQVCERRDSAILLMGFTGAFRRSELVALTGADIVVHRLDGVHVRVRRSKTDQEGAGTVHALPRAEDPARCPACAVVRWMQVVAAFDTGGRPAVIALLGDEPAAPLQHACRGATPRVRDRSPVLRSCRNGVLSEGPLSGAAVHAAVRRRALRAGFDPAVVDQLGAHSLRAGFVTQAARSGADALAIMRQTDHRTPAMVTRYIRESAPLVGNAVTELGL
ncbi:integrase [Mycolicibacterium conceptionense]|uniref:Integrase n=1 Tax=Mycolicibacterium conceptionense TaxID=451644 RepID=A0A0J8U314_9MYCO|nr:tyrosine-type recombinase/integrase [Mycolicibacterium conceptionense]KMV15891.1 integrase [Mycolicibacterium conceptionense]